jgi:hypothetical protein
LSAGRRPGNLAAAKASIREVFFIHTRRDRRANGFSLARNASYFTV